MNQHIFISAIFSVFLSVIANQSFGYTSGMAFSSDDKGKVFQVYVNGKLYNKTPSAFLRIKSTQGTFHLRVRIVDLHTHTSQEITQTVHLTKGFEYYYTVVQQQGKKGFLQQTKRYPIYSRYFLDYGLYTRAQTS